MDEKELIDNLRRLDVAEPRLGFDPDELAGRAAKRRRTQRQLLATAAGTLVVIGMAVGTLLYASAGESLPLSPASPTTSKTRPPTKVNGPDMSKQVARIRAHAEQVLPTLLPDTQGLQITAETSYGMDYVQVGITFRDSAGPARVNLSVTGPVMARTNVFTFRETCNCETPLAQLDGSKVYFEKPTAAPSTKRPAQRHAAAYRVDGSIVSVYHDNGYGSQLAEQFGIKDAKGEGISGFRNRFPLTDEQIIALITDPAFNVN